MLYDHVLLVLDDDELYEQKIPISPEDISEFITLTKEFIYQRFSVSDPVVMNEDFTLWYVLQSRRLAKQYLLKIQTKQV